MMRYHRHKGWRRHPGHNGRPVYFMPMSKPEIIERRFLYGFIGTFVMLVTVAAMVLNTL